MKLIVLLIFFALPGLVYGFVSKPFSSTKDITKSMESITGSLISFIVFAFFCPSSLTALASPISAV